jgi:hypothetical protein
VGDRIVLEAINAYFGTFPPKMKNNTINKIYISCSLINNRNTRARATLLFSTPLSNRQLMVFVRSTVTITNSLSHKSKALIVRPKEQLALIPAPALRTISNFASCQNLNPNYVTGISDAESCFSIQFLRRPINKTGWVVKACFSIKMHSRDRALLEKIQLYFGVGKVYDCQGCSTYRVESLKELTVIINHFDQFPLLTQKRADFELFKSIVDLMNRKVHRTSEGIQQVVNIKASLNNGLSDKLKESFPNTIPIARPLMELPENIESL